MKDIQTSSDFSALPNNTKAGTGVNPENNEAKTKALLRIETLLQQNRNEGWTRRWDDELDTAYGNATELGARQVDFYEAELKIEGDPKKRQDRFTEIIQEEELGGMTLDEAVALRNKFGLKG